jgi:hypothetical protein
MVLYLFVLIVFSLHRESLKLILATNPFLRWFCHRVCEMTSGARPDNKNWNLNFKTILELICSKSYLPKLQKFQLKY